MYYGCQGFDEEGGGVERFDARELEAVLLRLLASANLDIVEDLQMIGQELDGGDQHMGVASCFQLWHDVGKVRLQPLFGRMTSALIAELPALIWQSNQPGNSRRCLFEMVDVIWFLLYDAFGHTVRR